MKIYTRGGDKGRTSLFTGARVEKDDARIEALGSIDELVAVLGLAKVGPGMEAEVRQRLEQAQTELYLIMTDIASGTEAAENAGGSGDARGTGDNGAGSRLPADTVQRLEAAMDALDAQLPELTDFVIPGTSAGSAALHHARTVCRRAERRVRSAAREHPLPEIVMVYLNRLSDLLFVLARWADRQAPEGGRIFRDTL